MTIRDKEVSQGREEESHQMKTMRTWLLLDRTEEQAYCRDEGKNSQRHLGGSRLNLASRLDQAMGGGAREKRWVLQ